MKDPATGAVVGYAPQRSGANLDAAVARARQVQRDWAGLSHAERSAVLNRAADAVEASAEALAELLSREQGKPLNGPNARFEVGACAGWLRAVAGFEIAPQVLAGDVFWGAFINTGQACAALKRLYVHESQYDQVCEALVDVAKKMPMGVGLDEENVLGPLQNKQQFDIVSGLVEEARAGGARILTGGDPEAGQPGYFYPVTLVADIDNDNPLVAQEQFGPALPIVKYTDLDQVIEWANGLQVGLGSSVWGTDLDAARAVAARLDAGTTWINKHGAVDPRVPFGGVRKSGYGLEFGLEKLKSVALPKVTSW